MTHGVKFLKTDFSSVDFFFLLRKDALWNKNIEQFLNSLLSFDAELLPHFVFIFKGFTRKEIRQLQERFNIKKNRFIINIILTNSQFRSG